RRVGPRPPGPPPAGDDRCRPYSVLPPPAGRAVRPVFEQDALGGEFGADAVGLADAPLAPRRRPRADALLDAFGVGFRAALQPVERRLTEQAHQLAAGF